MHDFVFIADHGRIGANQTALAARIVAMAPDLLLSGGDGVYAEANGAPGDIADATAISTAWGAFSGVTCPIVVAPGNHERDGQPTAAGYLSHFAAITGGSLYYRYYHAASRTGIYVLDSGFDTSGVQRQPDGVGRLSDQGEWLRDQVIANAGDEDVRLIMQHHPQVGYATLSSRVRTQTDFYPGNIGVVAQLSGHTHCNWCLERSGVLHFGCGETTGYSPDKARYRYGNTNGAVLLHRDEAGISGYSQPSVLKITRDGNMTTFRFIRVSDGFVVGPKWVRFASPK